MHGTSSQQSVPSTDAATFTTLDTQAVIDAKARYWSKIAIFAPVKGSPLKYLKYYHNVWYGETRMVWLSDG